MIIRQAVLKDFRSYESAAFDFAPEVNIICGDNGRGKTNLLEAVWLLSGVRSWRTAKKAELVRWGQPKAKIEARAEARDREFVLELEVPAAGRTAVKVNGVRSPRQSRLSEVLRCVLFSPEDLFLVKGPAAGRRAFLDAALCQLRPHYSELLSRYERVLESKSRLLRQDEPAPPELLATYSQQLCTLGAQLLGYRASLCRGLNEECPKMHAAISDGKEQLSLCYQTVSAVTDPFAPVQTVYGQLCDHMEAHREAELASRSCLSGIHRDDVEICINDRPARAFASQGQTRSAALSLKFGQRELFYRDTGEYPVLLLDDVLSELDERRKAFVASHALGGQSIITCCEDRSSFPNASLIALD